MLVTVQHVLFLTGSVCFFAGTLIGFANHLWGRR
jgi:hypothetical protein